MKTSTSVYVGGKGGGKEFGFVEQVLMLIKQGLYWSILIHNLPGQSWNSKYKLKWKYKPFKIHIGLSIIQNWPCFLVNVQISRCQDSRWNHQNTTKVLHIITCLPLINSHNTPAHHGWAKLSSLQKAGSMILPKLHKQKAKPKRKQEGECPSLCTRQYIKWVCFISFPSGSCKGSNWSMASSMWWNTDTRK